MNSDVKYPRLLPRFARPTPARLREARRFTRQVFGERFSDADEIPGWLHLDQAAMLCHAAHLCPAGPIVEIGSFKGRSTTFIAHGMKDTNTLIAIDPHLHALVGSRKDRKRAGIKATADTAFTDSTSWETFHQTLSNWNIVERVRVVRDYSYNFRREWSDPIAMLWIDGDHTYDGVRRDIEDWVDLVMPGGFLAFHDTHPGYGGDGAVRRAILDAGVLTHRGFRTHLELRNAWYMQRVVS